jgi:hypothetical protein
MYPEDANQDFQVTLSVLRPGFEETDDFSINFSGGENTGVVHRLKAMPLDEPGTIQFDLRLNGREVAKASIVVHAADADRDDQDLFRYSVQAAAKKQGKKTTAAAKKQV